MKRMFSKTITSSSRFLMMPESTQNLYFHLGMNSDDDGFCEHFTIMRMIGSKPDDLSILQVKKFVHVFDDRVLVVLDWKENNYIRSDRYTASKYNEIYKEELALLSEGKEQGSLLGIPSGIPVVASDKVRLDKVSIDKRKRSIDLTPSQKAKVFFSSEEKQNDVIKHLVSNGMKEPYAKEQVKKFISYWTEPNKSGTKSRWEGEKYFDLGRRFGTWFKNCREWNKESGKSINERIGYVTS